MAVKAKPLDDLAGKVWGYYRARKWLREKRGVHLSQGMDTGEVLEVYQTELEADRREWLGRILRAEDRIRAIRKLDERHNFALMCHDVSSLAQYGKVSNEAYRLIRMLTPGPYTFILPSTRETPRRLQDRKRKTVGLRVPAHPFLSALTAELGEPVMGSTLFDDALDVPYAEPDDMLEQLRHAVDAVVDAGAIGIDMTTVLDLTGGGAALVREGKGDIDAVAEWL